MQRRMQTHPPHLPSLHRLAHSLKSHILTPPLSLHLPRQAVPLAKFHIPSFYITPTRSTNQPLFTSLLASPIHHRILASLAYAYHSCSTRNPRSDGSTPAPCVSVDAQINKSMHRYPSIEQHVRVRVLVCLFPPLLSSPVRFGRGRRLPSSHRPSRMKETELKMPHRDITQSWRRRLGGACVVSLPLSVPPTTQTPPCCRCRAGWIYVTPLPPPPPPPPAVTASTASASTRRTYTPIPCMPTSPKTTPRNSPSETVTASIVSSCASAPPVPNDAVEPVLFLFRPLVAPVETRGRDRDRSRTRRPALLNAADGTGHTGFVVGGGRGVV